MDEYVIDVVINGEADSLKTWCSSVYSAVDSMIGIDMVEDIKTITRTLDGKVWGSLPFARQGRSVSCVPKTPPHRTSPCLPGYPEKWCR